MTGFLTAVGQHKGRRSAVALFASAMLISATGSTSIAGISDTVAVDRITTASVAPAEVPHELRIELTTAGTEALDLSARLHELGGLITRPIKWTIKRQAASSNAAASVAHRSTAPVIDTQLDPGNYVVEAEYGYHRVVHPVNLLPGHRLGITLILNVGGIRAMSKLEHTNVPTGIDAQHMVYAISGPNRGHLVVDNAGQGHVLRLAAGTYRVESRFLPGNTIAESTVTVKPGILSSMEVAHKAGLARITVGTDLSAAVAWEIRSLTNDWSRSQTVPEAAMVLAPGKYRVTAIVNGTTVTEEFAIEAGESRHVRLGFF